jgi:hypothetical protein
MKKLFFAILIGLVLILSGLKAQTVISISGLYDTGETSSQTLTAGGKAVSYWSTTYASTNGGSTANSTFEGTSYAITASAVSASGYTTNTGTAEWIVANGASTSASHTTGSQYVNKGGNYLPGNGTGTNEGIYVYTLAFTITETGVAAGTKITAPLSIDMTIAADDGYTVYLNPLGYNKDPTTAPSNYDTSVVSFPQGQWDATTQIVVNTTNAILYAGINYLSIEVDNTNGISGSSSSTAWNESGLLDYNISAWNDGTEIWDNGAAVVPVPEEGSWIPIALGIALAGYGIWKKRQRIAA